jgi:uncharacterized membrane-anchored protein YhcB (DUF1043 family)
VTAILSAVIAALVAIIVALVTSRVETRSQATQLRHEIDLQEQRETPRNRQEGLILTVVVDGLGRHSAPRVGVS